MSNNLVTFEKDEFEQIICLDVPKNETDPPGFGLLFYTTEDKPIRIENSLKEVLEQTKETLGSCYDNWGRAYSRMLRDLIAGLTEEYEKELEIGSWTPQELSEAYKKIDDPT